MDIQKGSIVIAKAGRDKGGCYVVLERDGSYALIADGKRRRVEHPKRKKLMHLSATNTVAAGSFETNPQVKRIIQGFKEGFKNGG